MEKLIPIINRLQDTLLSANIPNSISLPQIVVVGSQSSGKSSVLESIVGRDFLPRGSGIVTRCPLQLKLVRINEDEEYGVFSHVGDCKFTDFSLIRDEIINRTQELTGNGKGITTKPIDLTIYSPKVLDISLVDLPGIVKISVSGQSEVIAKQIREMIIEYIQNPNAIILAVSPANNDLANSDALHIAQMVDPRGERTLGVLTKIDIMDRGTDALSMLNGSVFPLRLGYVGIICRSQEDINNGMPMDIHSQLEDRFFKESPIYGRISDRLGVRYLRTRLNKLLMDHINNTIPEVKKNIMDLLQAVESELESYGQIINEKEEKSAFLLTIIQKVVKSYQDNIAGKNLKNVTEELLGGARINYIFHSIFKNMISSINPLDEVSDQDIRTAIMNSSGLRGSLFVPETAFEVLIKQQIPRLKDPSLRCMSLVYEELKQIIYKLDIPELERFSNLKEKVSEVINNLLSRCLEPTGHMISDIVEVEMGYINSKHPQFIGGTNAILELQNVIKSPSQDMLIDKKPVTPVPARRDETPPPSSSFWPFSRSQTRPQRELKFEDLENERQDNSGPPMRIRANMNPTQEESQQTELIKILIKSYYNIVKTNVSDLVPKTIMGFLVNKSREELQRELVKELYKDNLYDVLLEEGGNIGPRREKCIKIGKGLRKAIDILNEVREYRISD
ncbi:unnamed protein product [Blepharisma stoltei]|uniref:Dynamin n=1 Tax=Blepharisma stoltei TaxID=1481888 RepID=A0AAU9KGK8_9CILI|nr:unnamed protein product [Blepharisma stoltei]